jgi:hypothetical protein
VCLSLSYYSSDLINRIILDDFKYNNEQQQVQKNKANLLVVCEKVIHMFDAML